MYIVIHRDGQITTPDNLPTSIQHGALIIIRVVSASDIEVSIQKNAFDFEAKLLKQLHGGTDQKGTLHAWLLGGTTDSKRYVEIHPWANPDVDGLDGIRVVLKVWRADDRTEFAEGTGDTIQDAFANAYTRLIQWLI
jgi:hypothetical protein